MVNQIRTGLGSRPAHDGRCVSKKSAPGTAIRFVQIRGPESLRGVAFRFFVNMGLMSDSSAGRLEPNQPLLGGAASHKCLMLRGFSVMRHDVFRTRHPDSADRQ